MDLPILLQYVLIIFTTIEEATKDTIVALIILPVHGRSLANYPWLDAGRSRCYGPSDDPDGDEPPSPHHGFGAGAGDDR